MEDEHGNRIVFKSTEEEAAAYRQARLQYVALRGQFTGESDDEGCRNILDLCALLCEIQADLIEEGVDMEYMKQLYETDREGALELARQFSQRVRPLTEAQRGWPNPERAAVPLETAHRPARRRSPKAGSRS